MATDPRQKLLANLESLIRKRTVDVFTSYTKSVLTNRPDLWTVARGVIEFPTVLFCTISEEIASSVRMGFSNDEKLINYLRSATRPGGAIYKNPRAPKHDADRRQVLLNHLWKMVFHRSVDLFGSYCHEYHSWTTIRDVVEKPGDLIDEIADRIANGVTTALNDDKSWPKHCKTACRPNVVILNNEQVKLIINQSYYMAKGESQLGIECQWFPGWQFGWVNGRIRAAGFIFGRPTADLDLLSLMIIRRDGSCTTIYKDGHLSLTPSLPREEWCPLPRTRLEIFKPYFDSKPTYHTRNAKNPPIKILRLRFW